MVRWIQIQTWQSSLIISAFSFFLFGGLDLLNVGLNSLAISLFFSTGVYFSRKLGWVSVAAIAVGTVFGITLGVRPGASGAISLIVLILVAAFSNKLIRYSALGVTALSGISLLWFAIYKLRGELSLFGLKANSLGQLNVFLFGSLLIVLACILGFLAGRLLFTQAKHVGTNFDKAIAERTQAKLALEIAEQNERFSIARDISELAIQRISAAISLADGGVYATKSDPEVASRILAEVAYSARQGHKELRRLFDMLNKLHEITAASPRISDLQKLVIAFRELGYNIGMSGQEAEFEIDEGAQLAIYRIVFDALDNIRKHTPLGTDITIDFSWTESGVQVLVKDNGIEVANRDLSPENYSYSIEDDKKSLVETITGAGITAMTERAALYQGTIEATRVPGVGFTVSAIFPNLRNEG